MLLLCSKRYILIIVSPVCILEKELRDAAHAEVALHSVPEEEQRTRKRKNSMNPDEKAQQR